MPADIAGIGRDRSFRAKQLSPAKAPIVALTIALLLIALDVAVLALVSQLENFGDQ